MYTAHPGSFGKPWFLRPFFFPTMLAEEHFEDIPAHTKPSVVDESDENGDGAVDVDMVSVCVCLCCVEMMSRHCDFMLGHNAAISPTVLHKKTRAHTHTHTHTHTRARAPSEIVHEHLLGQGVCPQCL